MDDTVGRKRIDEYEWEVDCKWSNIFSPVQMWCLVQRLVDSFIQWYVLLQSVL